MKCSETRRLLQEPEAKREAHPRYPELAGHLEACEACRHDQAEVETVSVLLREWPSIEPTVEDRQAAVAAMVAALAIRSRRPRSLAWSARFPAWRPASAAMALAICVLLVLLWPSGPGADPVAAVCEALDGVSVWSAHGTITPAIIPIGGRPTNRIEVQFVRPDTMRASMDGDLVQMLQQGDTRTWYVKPMRLAVIEKTEAVDFVKLFSVNEWLTNQAVLATPARVVGEEWFLPQRVKTIEVRIADTHPDLARRVGLNTIILHANVDSMLPVHAQAEGFAQLRDEIRALLTQAGVPLDPVRSQPSARNTASDYLTLHLHFGYGGAADPAGLKLDLPEGTTVLDQRG